MKREFQQPEVSCIGKDKHTMEFAQRLAGRMRSGRTTAYKCEHCGAWHIGSTSRPKGSRRRS